MSNEANLEQGPTNQTDAHLDSNVTGNGDVRPERCCSHELKFGSGSTAGLHAAPTLATQPYIADAPTVSATAPIFNSSECVWQVITDFSAALRTHVQRLQILLDDQPANWIDTVTLLQSIFQEFDNVTHNHVQMIERLALENFPLQDFDRSNPGHTSDIDPGANRNEVSDTMAILLVSF
jgi:hypothetical protein